MKTTPLIAVAEFNRLKGAAAWSPMAKPIGIMRNQHGARYTFEDGSRLYLYFNGSASCERVTADVLAFNKDWHRCTK